MKMKEIIGSDLIQDRVKELGKQISKDFKGLPLVAVCVLKGAFMFYADLVRSLTVEHEVDFVRISSYAERTSSTGNMIFSKDMEIPIRGKHVLIVEDIVDTGHSASYLTNILKDRGPESVSLCALIDKHERREVRVRIDYPGFVLQEGFIVGYGLDYSERYRSLSAIFQLIFEE